MRSLRSSTPSRSASLASAVVIAAAASAAVIAYKTSRAETSHPARGRFVTVDGVRLHYIEAGSGPPVVMLHGNGAMTDDLRISGLIEAVSRTRHAVAYDRPGFGYSERPRATTWTPTRQAHLIAEANTQLGLERSVILAHSWGTLVALALALDHPDKVAALVLVSGFYYPETRMGDAAFAPAAAPVVGDLLNHTVSPWIGAATAGAMIKAMFAPEAVPERFSREFPVALTLRPSQIKAFAEETVGMNAAAASLCDRYAQIRCPTTIVAGDADTIVDVDQAKRLHAAISGSSLIVKPGASHMLHHSMSGDIVQAIEDIGLTSGDTIATREAEIIA
jgi:pimeloyl-ACP methyl ester carboxylesterase